MNSLTNEQKIRSLFEALEKSGFKLISVDNFQDETSFEASSIETAMPFLLKAKQAYVFFLEAEVDEATADNGWVHLNLEAEGAGLVEDYTEGSENFEQVIQIITAEWK
jgi:hypothetical protein